MILTKRGLKADINRLCREIAALHERIRQLEQYHLPEGSRGRNILDCSLDILKLNPQLQSALDHASITTVRELVARSPGGIIKIKGIWKTYRARLEGELRRYGLHLGMTEEEIRRAARRPGMHDYLND